MPDRPHVSTYIPINRTRARAVTAFPIETLVTGTGVRVSNERFLAVLRSYSGDNRRTCKELGVKLYQVGIERGRNPDFDAAFRQAKGKTNKTRSRWWEELFIIELRRNGGNMTQAARFADVTLQTVRRVRDGDPNFDRLVIDAIMHGDYEQDYGLVGEHED